jgi:hypothetical protein
MTLTEGGWVSLGCSVIGLAMFRDAPTVNATHAVPRRVI